MNILLLALHVCHIDRNRGIYQGFLPLQLNSWPFSPDPLSKMRLLSASKKESGSWLHTLPVTSLGLLRMDDNTIRIAIGLRLGAPLCTPHLFITVEQMWTHSARMGSVVVLVLLVNSAIHVP